MARPLDKFFGSTGVKPRRSRRIPLSPSVGRLRAMLLAVAVVFSLAAGRAIQVQAIDATDVAAQAADQITVAHDIPAFRGEVLDRNGEVLVFTEATVTVIADPEMIRTNGKFDQPMTSRDIEVAATAADRIADLLASNIGGDVNVYRESLKKLGSRYTIVARNVSAATYSVMATAMKADGLIGIYKESAPTRRYPNGTLAANILGFVDEKGKGAAGLEYVLNSTLSGKPGREEYETSPNGKIPMGTNVLTPARNGQDWTLTLDAGLQWQVEQVLAERVRVAKANSGVALVMNIKTGEILALANFPSFDPNDYGSSDPKDLQNRAVTDAYTPGSVQKVLTFAALLDAGLVKATDVVEIPQRIRSGDQWITDAFSHTANPEVMFVRGIIARSSNIGAIMEARKMDSNRLRDYLLSFGLGAKTGIGLPGESAGQLPGANMPGYSRDGIAFGGSALAVTVVQEAAAIAAVTNGGIYNAPHILASTTTPDGAVQPVTVAEPRRVISAEASTEVVSMMESMVAFNESKGSKTFSVDGYRTGTKTGTSKKFDKECGCFKGLVTSTIGVGPVEDPQLLTYVVVDNPRRGGSGTAVAAPAYRDIMALALSRYGVTASKAESPSLPVYP